MSFESSSDYGCRYTYDIDINGTGASTTGNIYGVYDMNGGAWEYVMSNYNDVVGGSNFGQSLTLESKYYNKYTSSIISEACNGEVCYSHTLSETANWYEDYQTMITNQNPWMVRGGRYTYTTDAGIFSFSIGSGGISIDNSFRLVATIK